MRTYKPQAQEAIQEKVVYIPAPPRYIVQYRPEEWNDEWKDFEGSRYLDDAKKLADDVAARCPEHQVRVIDKQPDKAQPGRVANVEATLREVARDTPKTETFYDPE